jgi:two-component system chemotaxis response regulator CheY
MIGPQDREEVVPLNVLVIDDCEVMREMIVKILRMSRLPLGEVLEAGNGEEGLRILRRDGIQLAIVDINMPVMNGEEMIDRIRRDPSMSSLPVVIVSAEGSDSRIEVLRGKGAGFVHKPFTPETLRDVIQSVTGATDEDRNGERTVPGGGPDS